MFCSLASGFWHILVKTNLLQGKRTWLMFSSSASAPSSFLVSSSLFCSYLSQAAWLSEKHDWMYFGTLMFKCEQDFIPFRRFSLSRAWLLVSFQRSPARFTCSVVEIVVVVYFTSIVSFKLELHLATQELWTLGLLGECCPLVQDCLEHLPLLVQLVDNLKRASDYFFFILIWISMTQSFESIN